MIKLLESKPIITTIILLFAGFLTYGIIAAIAVALGGNTRVSTSVAEIFVAILYFVLFIQCFDLKKSFKGCLLLLPATLFALYKIPLCFITNGKLSPLTVTILLGGLAPALFEEVIFRGLLIHGLKKKNKSPMAIVLISSIGFSIVHLINCINMPLPTVLLQVLFAFAVGTIFGAVYLRTKDFLSLVILHAITDILTSIFPGGQTPSNIIIGLFILMLIGEIIYGMILTKNTKNMNQQQTEDMA